MDTPKTSWEVAVRNATEGAGGGGSPARLPASLFRAQLAREFEGAHERALADARQVAESAARLVRRLEQEGLAATCSGVGFLSDAHAARESVLRFEFAREAFGAAVRAAKLEDEARR